MRRDFPALLTFRRTSDSTTRYNCHAWAADDSTQWWEPVPAGFVVPPWIKTYWPRGVPISPAVSSYAAAFETRKFVSCTDGALEAAFEKIAVYGRTGAALHTARQLPSGTWT